MHESVVDRFFHAFRRRDGEAMASCYHPRAVFRDPVFGRLEGERIGAMWRMLTSGASSLELTILDTVVEGHRASARWVAVYSFAVTGRVVRNEVRSEFEFDRDLVVAQEDTFSFPAWARQALGGAAIPFAWMPVYRRRATAVANAQLDRYLAGTAG